MGDEVRVPIGDSGGTLVLVLDAITTAEECPGRAAPRQTPSQSVFVVLDLRAAVEGHSEATYAPTGGEMFRVSGSDGLVQAISSTEESWACFEDADLLPPFVDSGSTVTGKVVLDSRTDHGTVTYGATAGWYWTF